LRTNALPEKIRSDFKEENVRGTVAKRIRREVYRDQAVHQNVEQTERRKDNTGKWYLFKWLRRAVVDPGKRRVYQQVKQNWRRRNETANLS